MRRMMLTAVLGLASMAAGASPVLAQSDWIEPK